MMIGQMEVTYLLKILAGCGVLFAGIAAGILVAESLDRRRYKKK
jgi:hypothetical protein